MLSCSIGRRVRHFKPDYPSGSWRRSGSQYYLHCSCEASSCPSSTSTRFTLVRAEATHRELACQGCLCHRLPSNLGSVRRHGTSSIIAVVVRVVAAAVEVTTTDEHLKRKKFMRLLLCHSQPRHHLGKRRVAQHRDYLSLACGWKLSRSCWYFFIFHHSIHLADWTIAHQKVRRLAAMIGYCKRQQHWPYHFQPVVMSRPSLSLPPHAAVN